MKDETISLKCNEIIDRFKTGFINKHVPGVKDDYSKEFSITFTDYGRILKVLVSSAKVIEISDVEQPSEYIDFSLDSLTLEELMSKRLALHKAFTAGRAKIKGNIFYGIKIAERLQALISKNPLPAVSVSATNSGMNVPYDHNEEFIQVDLGEKGSIQVKVGYRDDTDCSSIMFIIPPDPLMGGYADNNIVTAIFNEAAAKGMVAVSFNYWGVETGSISEDAMFGFWQEMQTTGNYSTITDDIKLITEEISNEFKAEARICFTGYSFGSYMALLAGSEIKINGKITFPETVCISPPILAYPFSQFLGRKGVSVITSPTDEFCPLDSLKEASEKFKFDIEVIESPDHFFRGKEKQLADKVMEQII